MRGLLIGCVAALALSGCGAGIGLGSADAPRGYARLFSPAPHAFRYSLPGEPVRRGEASERFELRDGDCGGSDCGNFRARAEIIEDRERTQARLDRDIWYGLSFFNGTIQSVPRERSLGTVIAQWKLAGEQPSVFRFVQVAQGDTDLSRCDPSVCTRAGDRGDDVMLDLDLIAQAQGWGADRNAGRVCRLFGMGESLGRWVDIVVNTNFGTDGYGYLRVWVDGELRCDYRGQLVTLEAAQAAAVTGPTQRRGLFQSFTRRWAETFGTAPKPTMIAYFDEVLVGASRAEVDTRLREAQGQPPKD